MRPSQMQAIAPGTPEDSPAKPGTYERLLAAAAAMFRQRGYEGTSTRELADVLGVQKASLYHYMSSKEELLYEMSTRSMDLMDARIAAAVQTSTGAIDRLTALIESHVEAMLENPDPYAASLLEMRSLRGEHARQLIARRKNYEKLVVEMVAAAQDHGALRADIGPYHLARLLLGTMNWTLFWYHPEGPVSPVEVAAMIRTVILDGFLVRTASDNDGEPDQSMTPESRARGAST